MMTIIVFALFLSIHKSMNQKNDFERVIYGRTTTQRCFKSDQIPFISLFTPILALHFCRPMGRRKLFLTQCGWWIWGMRGGQSCISAAEVSVLSRTVLITIVSVTLTAACQTTVSGFMHIFPIFATQNLTSRRPRKVAESSLTKCLCCQISAFCLNLTLVAAIINRSISDRLAMSGCFA